MSERLRLAIERVLLNAEHHHDCKPLSTTGCECGLWELKDAFAADKEGKKTPLTEDEEVALWNAICVAGTYTAQLPEHSRIKQRVAAGVKIALQRGFPYDDKVKS